MFLEIKFSPTSDRNKAQFTHFFHFIIILLHSERGKTEINAKLIRQSNHKLLNVIIFDNLLFNPRLLFTFRLSLVLARLLGNFLTN